VICCHSRSALREIGKALGLSVAVAAVLAGIVWDCAWLWLPTSPTYRSAGGVDRCVVLIQPKSAQRR
jgi:hypothetical protein